MLAEVTIDILLYATEDFVNGFDDPDRLIAIGRIVSHFGANRLDDALPFIAKWGTK